MARKARPRGGPFGRIPSLRDGGNIVAVSGEAIQTRDVLPGLLRPLYERLARNDAPSFSIIHSREARAGACGCGPLARWLFFII
ncbi:MAG: hypothetical protein LBT00_01500 [Spirochaetaceae bacterium]|nr:hypothetical protein [Spirochaetaceae bacterium]